MRSKAISPLIATVLLIAFVMAIASIVFGWGSGFVNGLLNPVSDKGPKTIQCIVNMDADKSDVVYNFSGSSSSVNVTVGNLGEVLYNFSFVVITNSGVYTFNPTNQYNETTPMSKGAYALFKTINATNSAPSSSETFQRLKITALCKKDYRIFFEVDMT